MRAAPEEHVVRIGANAAAPRLSVLTPFYRHDPSALLERLAGAPAGVEFVLIDDGSASAELFTSVVTTLRRLGAPTRLITLAENQGRAAARNRLITEAAGEYVLFLDADMAPDSRFFLKNWLGVIDTCRPDVAFGGLSLAHIQPTRATALHHRLFARSDCRLARARARAAAQFTATSNLLVRRAFLDTHPFDAGFTGWGFEDTDWALNAVRETEILHVENPATHAGLDDIDTLLRKSAQAGPNFARLARKHPRQVSRFAAHRAARVLRRAPARTSLRHAFEWLARDPIGAAPMSLRCAALKLFRASHYAEHLA